MNPQTEFVLQDVIKSNFESPFSGRHPGSAVGLFRFGRLGSGIFFAAERRVGRTAAPLFRPRRLPALAVRRHQTASSVSQQQVPDLVRPRECLVAKRLVAKSRILTLFHDPTIYVGNFHRFPRFYLGHAESGSAEKGKGEWIFQDLFLRLRRSQSFDGELVS